jgi:hypothetical protein
MLYVYSNYWQIQCYIYIFKINTMLIVTKYNEISPSNLNVYLLTYNSKHTRERVQTRMW